MKKSISRSFLKVCRPFHRKRGNNLNETIYSKAAGRGEWAAALKLDRNQDAEYLNEAACINLEKTSLFGKDSDIGPQYMSIVDRGREFTSYRKRMQFPHFDF